MTTSELLLRLRGSQGCAGQATVERMCKQAADEIERLRKELQEALEEVAYLRTILGEDA